MKKFILFAKGVTILVSLIAFTTVSAFADIVISNGTTMMVESSASVIVSDNITIETGATVDNSGTVLLRGDFTNNGTSALGSGSLVFEGSAAQAIAGSTTSEFGNVEVDNSAGVNLNIHAQVNGTLTLTDGLLTIGTNNLIFGELAAAVAGTPSSTNMIVAESTGQVRKLYTSGAAQNPGAFVFPVGEVTGTTEYSPISIDFNLVDVAAGGYIGINLSNAKEPDNFSTDNYINRYWSMEASGLSNYNYDWSATYLDADVAGSEADMSGALYDGANWLIGDPANTGSNLISGTAFTDDGNFTGVEFRIFANLGLVLEGAYNNTADEMTTSINGVLPLTAASAYSHIGYTGTESVGAIPSADIVDWILVEVRDAISAGSATTPGDTVAGFLLKDGSIVGMDGVSPISFTSLITNNPYFVIIHRNHLSVMTASSPAESFGNYVYNFSDSPAKAYGTDALTQVDTSPIVYALFGGETNQSGVITYADKEPVDLNINVSGYELGDTNFSGVVTYADKQYTDFNINEATQVPQ